MLFPVQFIGNTAENHGSIRLMGVRLLDEGMFTCIFSVSSGSYRTEIPLTVFVSAEVSITVDVSPVIEEMRVGQPWPVSSVRAEGDILHLLSLSSELNGLYVCEASNPYGRATGSLYVHTSS
ncbi:unnamed protein product, partial [Coregonus sp. 'balchen']